MVRSSFWFGSAFLALLPVAGVRAQDAGAGPPPAVIDVSKNSAGSETKAQGLMLDDSGLVVTVAASVEEKATFTCSVGGKTVAAKVAIFEPNARLLLLQPAERLAAAASKPRPAAPPLPVAERLWWFPPSSRQPAVFAGPVQSLDGRPLALTLRRIHFATSDPAVAPHPGTPVFSAAGQVLAFALSPLPDSEGAWLCLPVEAAVKVAEDFRASGHAETGQLEFGIATGTSTPRIEFVKPGSRAEKAGLLAGDIILEIAGRPVVNCLDILDANYFQTTRKPVPLRILRGIETLVVIAPAVTK